MQLLEEKQDLFTVDKDYVLVHCISADFALGAGIAKEFTKRGVKQYLETHYTTPKIGTVLLTYATGWQAEANLVTKEKYWQKPTYISLIQSLDAMKCALKCLHVNKIAMPRIGCGLDKLQWEKVKQIIIEIFADTDIEILVCAI